jgi:hypothetical protein
VNADIFKTQSFGAATKNIKMEDPKNEGLKNKGQSKIYFKLYAGNGLFTPGSYRINSQLRLSYNGAPLQATPYPYVDTLVKTHSRKGIGGGWRIGGGIGVLLNDFINIGLDAEYINGHRLTNAVHITVDNNDYASTTEAIDFKILTLTPYIIFKALSRPNYFLYNQLGIAFTMPSALNTSGRFESLFSNYNYPNSTFYNIDSTQNEKYKLSLGIGLRVAFGINFRVSNKVRVFGEVFGNYIALYPSSSNRFSSSKDLQIDNYMDASGVLDSTISKVINNRTTNISYQKGGNVSFDKTSYQENGVTSDGYKKTITTYAEQSHRYAINMAVLGINIGIIYRF